MLLEAMLMEVRVEFCDNASARYGIPSCDVLLPSRLTTHANNQSQSHSSTRHTHTSRQRSVLLQKLTQRSQSSRRDVIPAEIERLQTDALGKHLTQLGQTLVRQQRQLQR